MAPITTISGIGVCRPGPLFSGPNSADGAVVVTVRVVVAVPSAGTVTLVGLNVHVAPAGAPAQVNETVPVNPSPELAVIVELADPPADTARLAGSPLNENPGGGFTVITMGADTDRQTRCFRYRWL